MPEVMTSVQRQELIDDKEAQRAENFLTQDDYKSRASELYGQAFPGDTQPTAGSQNEADALREMQSGGVQGPRQLQRFSQLEQQIEAPGATGLSSQGIRDYEPEGPSDPDERIGELRGGKSFSSTKRNWGLQVQEEVGSAAFRTAEELNMESENAKAYLAGIIGTEAQQNLPDNFEPKYVVHTNFDSQLANVIMTGGHKGGNFYYSEHPDIAAHAVPPDIRRIMQLESELERGTRAHQSSPNRDADQLSEFDRTEIEQEVAELRKKNEKFFDENPDIDLSQFKEGVYDVDLAYQAVQLVLDDLNDLEDRMQDAAVAGDNDLAEELLNQRNDILNNHYIFKGETGRELRGAFTEAYDAEGVAKGIATTPTAQSLGVRVRKSEELFDPESEEYQKRFSGMTEGALGELESGRTTGNRLIDQGMQEAARQSREFGLAGGIARNPQEMAAIMSRVDQMSAGQRAEVELQSRTQSASLVASAHDFLTRYADAYNIDTHNALMGYIHGDAPAIRDVFAAGQVAVLMANVNYQNSIYIAQSERATAIDYLEFQKDQQEFMETMAIVDTTVGFAAAVMAPFSTFAGSAGAAAGEAWVGGGSQATPTVAGGATAAEGTTAAGGTTATGVTTAAEVAPVVAGGSSKDYKRETGVVDSGETAERIAALPLQRWVYKVPWIADRKDHLGPYAEDWQEAFGVGDGKSIDFLDGIGVAMAGIQGAMRKIEALEKRIEELQGKE